MTAPGPARSGPRTATPDRTSDRGRSADRRGHFAGQRERTRALWARADAECARAQELRTIAAAQQAQWRRWHRLWARVAGAPRPLLRMCMYCAHVYVALPLARGEGEADGTWRAVPWWVRERIGTPGLRVIPSHGICPACARRHDLD